MIEKSDILLMIFFLIIGLCILIYNPFASKDGELVRVTVEGQLYGTYPLNIDKEITIERNNHVNHIIIKNGTVQMASSNCKNQICVKEGRISHTKETIVCLPNRVLVEIVSDNKEGIDVIS